MKKAFKRLISILLGILTVITILPMNVFPAFASAAEIKTGDIISFGTYPQTKVSDTSLIASLNALALSDDNTVIFSNAKYKRVYFTEYTPSQTTYTPNAENSFQDENGYFVNTVYWFKYEPIQWRVLANSSGELFLMSEKILDAGAYNNANASVTWQTCTLRSWLNTDFYNSAFSSAERLKIIPSYVINQEDSVYDNLYLLSVTEVNSSSYGFNSDSDRSAKGTDYSKSHGLLSQAAAYAGASMWWLRTPHGNCAAVVGESGFTGFGYSFTHTFFGIRPVFKIKLTTFDFTVLTFDANGGTGSTVYYSKAGDTLTAPGVTKPGYTFAGWFPALPAAVPLENTTYIAQWNINSYTITFNANGGTGAAPPVNQIYNSSVELPATGFERIGYTFIGWNTTPTATTALTNYTVPAGNATLYAVWSPMKFTIILMLWVVHYQQQPRR